VSARNATRRQQCRQRVSATCHHGVTQTMIPTEPRLDPDTTYASWRCLCPTCYVFERECVGNRPRPTIRSRCIGWSSRRVSVSKSRDSVYSPIPINSAAGVGGCAAVDARFRRELHSPLQCRPRSISFKPSCKWSSS
jgi:hypothetical protein